MSLDYKQIQTEVKPYVETYFDIHYNDRYVYHSIKHTHYVVRRVEELGNHFQLNDRELFLVVAAAWFHDTGYFTNHEHHEEEGAKIAGQYLKEKGLPEADLAVINSCIMATKLPQTPKNLLEEILCDSDLYNLGTDDFGLTNQLMHQEYEALHQVKMGNKEWAENTIKLLGNLEYHTDYCRLLLKDKKEENFNSLKKKAKKGDKESKKKDKEQNPEKSFEKPAGIVSKGTAEFGRESISEPKGKAEGKETNSKASLFFADNTLLKKNAKGVETMFKISSNNNQRMSKMADYKARVMISVNSIILSVVIALLLRYLDKDPFLTIPTFILLAVCVVSLIFAILATRPTVPDGTFSDDQVREKEANLLFFGNFYKMSLESYETGMIQVMQDQDFLYRSLIRDVYFQGVVMGKKFKLLRYSFNVFMYGLIISVIAFMIAISIVVL